MDTHVSECFDRCEYVCECVLPHVFGLETKCMYEYMNMCMYMCMYMCICG